MYQSRNSLPIIFYEKNRDKKIKSKRKTKSREI